MYKTEKQDIPSTKRAAKTRGDDSQVRDDPHPSFPLPSLSRVSAETSSRKTFGLPKPAATTALAHSSLLLASAQGL